MENFYDDINTILNETTLWTGDFDPKLGQKRDKTVNVLGVIDSEHETSDAKWLLILYKITYIA